MDLSLFAECPIKQKNGTPIYIDDGVFEVRRWGTPESIKLRRQIAQELFGPIHTPTDDDDSEIWGNWLVEYGIVSWSNVFDQGGKELDYSKRNARKIFLNPEYMCAGNINSMLINAAANYENFLYEEAEEAIESIKK